MSHLKRKRFLMTTGGVALADILANSVAVILILIVVTMSVQQDRADNQLEQNADITSILARQLASSVVYNDLPSSPPARLHDYYSCEIAHDCDPSLFPIVELHQNYIREYNSNLRFYRNELLQENNAFDDLINTFSNTDRAGIRIDVYDVNLYYLAIGILKEHNISPRHWHYLGENATPPVSAKQALAEGGHGEADAVVEAQSPGNAFNANAQSQSTDLPEGTEYADVDALQSLQISELLPPSSVGGNDRGRGEQQSGSDGEQSGQSPSGNSNQPGSEQRGSEQPGEGDQLVTPDTMFESLVELFGSEDGTPQNGNSESQQSSSSNGSGQSNQPPQRRSMRLRVPNSSNLQQQQSGPAMQLSVNANDYDQIVLTFLMDQLMLARQQRSAFVEEADAILIRYAMEPDLMNAHPLQALIRTMSNHLKQRQQQPDLQWPPLNFETHDQAPELLLATNYQSTTQTLIVNESESQWTQFLVDQNPHKISLILRSFPGLFGGQTMQIPADALIMMHPQEIDFPELQWRPIVITDVWLENPAIGFIRSSIRDGELVLEPQTHQTKINDTLIAEPRKMDNRQQPVNAQMLYVLIFLMCVGLLYFRWLSYSKSELQY